MQYCDLLGYLNYESVTRLYLHSNRSIRHWYLFFPFKQHVFILITFCYQKIIRLDLEIVCDYYIYFIFKKLYFDIITLKQFKHIKKIILSKNNYFLKKYNFKRASKQTFNLLIQDLACRNWWQNSNIFFYGTILIFFKISKLTKVNSSNQQPKYPYSINNPNTK